MPKIQYQNSRAYHQSRSYREPPIPERTIKVSRDRTDPTLLVLRFAYNDEIRAFVKTIPGRVFQPERKVWLVPDTLESRRLIRSVGEFGWYFFIDSDVALTEPSA